jgi:NAD(P)-dependent dehydrogenase (short-subunit alcohol dehydrogenase family)
MDWSNKVVLITGASSGIGRGLALELARRGAKIGLLARGTETAQAMAAAAGAGTRPSSSVSSVRPAPRTRLQEVVSEIESSRDAGSASGTIQALELPADVRDANAVRAAADRLRKEFGRIDVMIANAGMGETIDASELDPEGVATLLSVNVIGVVNSVAAVLTEMIKRGSGQLVVISSLAAYRGLPKSAAYCSSKAAVSAFFESLRLDLEPKGIAVTIIHPGFIKTRLTAGRNAKMPFLMELDDAVEKIVRAIEKRKKSYAFPWQLATIVRAGMVMPIFMYDWISRRNSYRE